MNIQYEIERLLKYGLDKSFIKKWDIISTRNALMELLKVEEPYNGKLEDEEQLDSPVKILNNILDYCAEKGIIKQNTTTYRDLMDAKIMGLLMPRQSEVVENFYKTVEQKGIKQAVDDYYTLSQNSNYIRTDRIAKNMYWKAQTEYGYLEITINLSKPEKDPKEIEKAKSMPQSSYPKCLLCIDNVGYAGRLNHPARQNHRVIPLILDGEQWYFQYSPYVYYNEHSIIFNSKHIPMKISEKTFKKVFDFIEQIPHYFIGSNADLPIVGGSILSHDHFQGGHHTFPMEIAEIKQNYKHPNYPEIKAGIVNWQMSVIRLSADKKEPIIKLATEILSKWREYSDETVDILAYTKQGTEKIPHNTITPIARKNKKGEYELDLVLRNNIRTEQYPDGIFHPHPHLHHIKKENIGLIEVMGLAVLPGRLKTELELIKEIFAGEKIYGKMIDEEKQLLQKHEQWIDYLTKKYGTNLTKEKADEILKKETALKFSQVLECAGVYKKDPKGQKAFQTFMEHVGFKK